MAKIVNEVGTKLSESMGLDPNKVLGIFFDWKPGRTAIIHVAMALEPDEMATVWKEYFFVEKADGSAIPST